MIRVLFDWWLDSMRPLWNLLARDPRRRVEWRTRVAFPSMWARVGETVSIDGREVTIVCDHGDGTVTVDRAIPIRWHR